VDYFQELRERLKSLNRKVSWLESENIHYNLIMKSHESEIKIDFCLSELFRDEIGSIREKLKKEWESEINMIKEKLN